MACCSFSPVAFVLIGSARLVYLVFLVGRSAERRSALVQKAVQLAPFEPPNKALVDYPAIPGGLNLTDSPRHNACFSPADLLDPQLDHGGHVDGELDLERQSSPGCWSSRSADTCKANTIGF